MKYYILSILLLTTIASGASTNVSFIEAENVAKALFHEKANLDNENPIKLNQVILEEKTSAPSYYIFNAPDNLGYAIVSGKEHPIILGYSNKGKFDVNNIPSQLKILLQAYANCNDNTNQNKRTILKQTKSNEQGAILLPTAEWGQGDPYNGLCPTIDGTNAPTGCVSTAMAIVMNFHQWPEYGRGNFAYGYNGKLYKYDFEHTLLDWTSVKNAKVPYSDKEKKELANIFLATGISVLTRYESSESSAFPNSIPEALNYFFKYDDECQLIDLTTRDIESRYQLIKEQLDLEQPVLYGAYSSRAGHIFIIDGYDTESMLHVNWGWDGLYNGYYSLDLLNPGDEIYWGSPYIITNIKPSSRIENPSPLWLIEYGLQVDVKNVEKDVPFNTNSVMVEGVGGFHSGDVALCLVNSEGAILEEVSIVPYELSIMGNTFIRFKNCMVHSEIKDDFSLKLFSRAKSDEKWKPIHGSIDLPVSVPVVGNELNFTPLSWEWEGDVKVECDREEYMDFALWDQEYVASVYFPHDEMVTIYINGDVMQPSHFKSETCPFPRLDYYLYNLARISMQFSREWENKMIFKVVTTPINELRSFEANPEEPNTLYTIMGGIENPLKIGELTVSGKICEDDLYYLFNNFPNIKVLDLSKAIFCDSKGVPLSILPSRLFDMTWNIETLALPLNIERMEEESIYCCYRLHTLKLPEGIKEIEPSALEFCFYLQNIYCPAPGVASQLIEAILFNRIISEEDFYLLGGGECTNIYVPRDLIEEYNEEEKNLTSIIIMEDNVIQPVNEIREVFRYYNFGNEIIMRNAAIVDYHNVNEFGGYVPKTLSEVNIPDEINGLPVRYITAGTFQGFNELKEIRLPSDLHEVGIQAFCMTGLEEIDLPSTITKLERSAFSSNPHLNRVVVHWQIPLEITEAVFDDYSPTLVVPDGTKELYMVARGWKNFYNILEESEFNGTDIDIIKSEINDVNVEVYNLSGIRVYEGDYSLIKDYLIPGFYVIKWKGRIQKIKL